MNMGVLHWKKREARDPRLTGPGPRGGPGQGRASLDGVVPDLHCPVGTAGHEDLGVVGVPGHSIHRHVVGIIGVEELAGVRFRALGSRDQRIK